MKHFLNKHVNENLSLTYKSYMPAFSTLKQLVVTYEEAVLDRTSVDSVKDEIEALHHNYT